MNKITYPDKYSISATTYFAEWLCLQMAEKGISAVELSRAIGVERKTVYAYCSGLRYPKLDTLAKIFHFLGQERIEIPMEVDDL